jgi:hypothetical protein
MHQVVVTWRAGIDPKRIKRSGASDWQYRMRLVAEKRLRELSRLDQTLCHCGLGHTWVRLVFELRKLGHK